MKPTVSIIIPTFNLLELTKLCLNSIFKTVKVPYELIVIDNGSFDGTPKFLKKLSKVSAIFNKNNRGFAGAVNQGIKLANGKYLIILNNDTIVTQGWLEELISGIQKNRHAGAISPSCNNIRYPQGAAGSYGDFRMASAFSKHWCKDKRGKVREVDILYFFCVLFKREVIKRVGCFDEGFGLGGGEDIDYCNRIRKAGWSLFVAEGAFVHHFDHSSYKSNMLDPEYIVARSGKILEKKQRKREKSKKNQLLIRQEDSFSEFLTAAIPPGLRKILCFFQLNKRLIATFRRQGYLLVQKYNASENPVEGRTPQEIEYIQFEENGFPFKEGAFDCMLFNEQLLQENQPGKLLNMYQRFLDDDGAIIICIPNLFNIETLPELLKGKLTSLYGIPLEKIRGEFLKHYLILNMLHSAGYQVSNTIKETGGDRKKAEQLVALFTSDKLEFRRVLTNILTFRDFIVAIKNEDYRLSFLSDSNRWFFLGETYHAYNLFSAATRCFQKVIKKEKNTKSLLLRKTLARLSLCLMQQKKYAEALGIARRWWAMNEESIAIPLIIASCYIGINNTKMALRILEKIEDAISDINRGSFNVEKSLARHFYYLKGISQKKCGRLVFARESVKQILKINPDDAWAKEELTH